MPTPAAENRDESSTEPIEYPEGEAHGVTIYAQLNDENGLYDALTNAQRRLNNERGDVAGSDNPHYLGSIDASWTDGRDQIGFFSSKQEYGKETEHGFTNYYGQYLNLYDDVDDAKIANNAAKRQIRIHKRSDDLVYPDGNPYSWPAGWITGEQREGTLIEIQASYVDSPGEAIAHAFELIEASELVAPAQLGNYKQLIGETVRFQGLEAHHRIHANHETDAIETLRDSARLSGREGDGRIEGNWQKGHHQIYGFETDSISLLGFDPGLSWEYGGDSYSDVVEGHYLKCYRHKSAEHFAQTDPRAHPKVEAKARGAYPGPAWTAVKNQLDAILNAHVADWAGVPQSGLVADIYHDGPAQDTTITQPPTNYRINLRDYFKSTGLKKDIISLLVNNRTDSAKDILYTVIRLGRPATYAELKDETGLTKRTLRKWVKKLEDLGVVRRRQSGQMFVRMSDFVRDHLRGFIEKAKPAGDVKRAIQRRKREREAKRNGETEATTDAPTTAVTDGGTNARPAPAEATDTNLTPTGPPEQRPDSSRTDPPPD
ncbi:MAG: winged helix-turn-helix domain-containing protein [Trueperaceae bacterium]|nr:winged helix-turn-helix domain-containing protein [Trueperaceae bacterium]